MISFNPTHARQSLASARLYGILDFSYTAPEKASAMTREMLAGGVQILQLRAKDHPSARILPIATELAGLCREAGVLFMVNDDPDLAAKAGADGAHVGQDDSSIAAARAALPGGAIVGKSTHSPEQAAAAVREGADYIGFGPIFSTPTKPTYIPVGTEQIQEINIQTPVPVFNIGGIKLENLPDLVACGLRRAVVVSGILLSPDPQTYCRACREILDAIPTA